MTVDINVRFDSKVVVEDRGFSTPCHIWTSAQDKDGYGLFQFSSKKTVRAHRWSYERAIGPIDKPHLRHLCDVTSCVNPSHLIPGTAQQNIADMIDRERDSNRRGAGHYNSKMTQESVDELRRRYKAGEKIYRIYKEFGISYSQAKSICSGRTWKSRQSKSL
jgi:hypothetical protein